MIKALPAIKYIYKKSRKTRKTRKYSPIAKKYWFDQHEIILIPVL
jgi:hypothetical protein